MNYRPPLAVLATALLSTTAFAGPPESKTVAPAPEDSWEFKLEAPAWIPFLEGDVGLHGQTAHVDLGPGDIIRRLDMVTDLRAEVHKDRFSLTAEYLYLSLSDSARTDTVVKKLDFRVDQHLADVGVAWRIIETPRGYLDLTAGVRYTNLYQRLTLLPDESRIEDVSQKLAVASTAARIGQLLKVLRGQNPPVPTAPIDADAIKRLQGAIPRIKGNTAERQEKIADVLEHTLKETVSRTDDWVDPYVGLRGQYNLNDKFYLIAKADIGGFGAGSDVSWEAEAALGCHVTKNIISEVGYRALGVDYHDGGLDMNTITHGVQLTLGLTF